MDFDIEKASRSLSELELKVKTGNLDIDVLWFRYANWKGNWKVNRHAHSSYEFHFIVSGRCLVILDETEFEVKPGEFYLNKPGVCHIQSNINGEEHAEYCLCCDLTLTNETDCEEKYILKILNEIQCKPISDSFGAAKLFERALGEAYLKEVGFYNNIKGLVMMIISSAARSSSKNFITKYQTPVVKHKNEHRIMQIDKFIEDNFAFTLSVNYIANHIFISEKQLCRIIVESKGMSTKEYIIKCKLKKAKELLKNSDVPLKEIAKALGFSSEYYFNQFFKREDGYPPGLYRKQIINV